MKRAGGVGVLCTALLLALLVIAGCGGSSSSDGGSGSSGSSSSSGSSAGGPTVGILPNSGIAANPIEIQAGESVTWNNQDPLTHWLVGEGGIDSGELRQYSSYTKVFEKAGTFPYECKLHKDLKGEVTVK